MHTKQNGPARPVHSSCLLLPSLHLQLPRHLTSHGSCCFIPPCPREQQPFARGGRVPTPTYPPVTSAQTPFPAPLPPSHRHPDLISPAMLPSCKAFTLCGNYRPPPVSGGPYTLKGRETSLSADPSPSFLRP